MLSETHRHLLQFIQSRGVVKEQILVAQLRIYRGLHFEIERANARRLNLLPPTGPVLSDITLQDHIRTLNTHLSPYYLTIDSAIFPKDENRAKYYAVKDTHCPDEIANMASTYDKDQLDFYHSVMTLIQKHNSERGGGTSLREARSERPKTGKCSIGQWADNTIESLVKDRWLHRDGTQLWFGPRACVVAPAWLDAAPVDGHAGDDGDYSQGTSEDEDGDATMT